MPTTSPDSTPIVLVHGSWGDERSWDPLVPLLTGDAPVVAYSRRGHAAGDTIDPTTTRRDHEDDLAELIVRLGTGDAHVVGNSYGGLIALGLAARRPELVCTVSVHEPPALGLLEDPEVVRSIEAVCEELLAGRSREAARRFVDEIALGPGAWSMLPAAAQETMVRTAPAFLAEWRDRLDGYDVDVSAVRRSGVPVLVTRGDASPAWLQAVAARLSALLPEAAAITIPTAGHVPHQTDPERYAPIVARHASRLRLAA